MLQEMEHLPNNTAIPSYYSTHDLGGAVQTPTDAHVIAVLTKLNIAPREGFLGPVRDVWRQFTWSMITSTAWLADSVSMLGTGMLTFLNMYTYQPVVDFLQQFDVFIILGSVFFFGIAWIAAMSKKEIPIVDMLKNGAFAWFTYFMLPILMMVGVGFVQNVSESISGGSTPSATVIKDNVYDIRAIDKANWDFTVIERLQTEGNGAPNFIDQYKDNKGDITVKSKELDFIDPTERLKNEDVKKLSEFGQKAMSKKLSLDVSKSENFVKKWKLVDLEQNLFKEDGHYYAYDWHWWTIELTLWGYILFSLILLLRMGRMVVEIFMHWVVGDVVVLSQWGSSKRTFEILSKIGMGFTTLLFTQCLNTLFLLGLLQLNDLLQAGKINFITYLILLFSLGMEMIDGPALWQQLFNIDAGIKSGWQNAWGGVMLVKQFSDMFNPFSAQRKMQRAMSGNGKRNKQAPTETEQPEQRTSENPDFENQNQTNGSSNENQKAQGGDSDNSQETKTPENKADNPDEKETSHTGDEPSTPEAKTFENPTGDEPNTPEVKTPDSPQGESQTKEEEEQSKVPRPEVRPAVKVDQFAPNPFELPSGHSNANPFELPDDDTFPRNRKHSEEFVQPETNNPWEEI